VSLRERIIYREVFTGIPLRAEHLLIEFESPPEPILAVIAN
jgi:hypothetical protein